MFCLSSKSNSCTHNTSTPSHTECSSSHNSSAQKDYPVPRKQTLFNPLLNSHNNVIQLSPISPLTITQIKARMGDKKAKLDSADFKDTLTEDTTLKEIVKDYESEKSERKKYQHLNSFAKSFQGSEITSQSAQTIIDQVHLWDTTVYKVNQGKLNDFLSDGYNVPTTSRDVNYNNLANHIFLGTERNVPSAPATTSSKKASKKAAAKPDATSASAPNSLTGTHAYSNQLQTILTRTKSILCYIVGDPTKPHQAIFISNGAPIIKSMFPLTMVPNDVNTFLQQDFKSRDSANSDFSNACDVPAKIDHLGETTYPNLA